MEFHDGRCDSADGSDVSPLDNAIGVVVGTNLVLTFSENVVAGTGNIVIKKVSDNSIVETIAASATVIAGAQVTIDPTVTLAEATGYYVNIDATAFKDGSNNFYAGIADATTWNFTTADATAPTVGRIVRWIMRREWR